MGEDVAPEVAHDALAEQAREYRVGIFACKSDHERRAEDHRRPPHQRHVARRKRDVDDALGHEGTDELRQTVEHQTAQRGNDEPAVGANVHEEPTHESAIVDFAEDILVVNDLWRRHFQ
jgi:hypothetical protein